MRFDLMLAVMAFVLAMAAARPAAAQSLYGDRGTNAVEAGVGWSYGPFSDGLETSVSVGLDGRLDLGLGFNRYTYDFDDGNTSTFREYAPFVRYFAVKEGSGGAPVSLAVSAQYFADDFEGADTGWYLLAGATVFKRLRLSETVRLYPFAGFSFVGESYTFGGGPADRAAYLARTLGFNVTAALDREGATLLRATVEEQSFRRETYRAARVGFVRRF
jgi:hypothetical protein